MGPLNLLFLVAAQDPPVPSPTSIADILDRGGVGVAALAIVGIVVLFWLYVRQARYYDDRMEAIRAATQTREDDIREKFASLQKETTEFLKDVAHSIGDIARSVDKRDARAEDTLRLCNEINRSTSEIQQKVSNVERTANSIAASIRSGGQQG